MLRASVLFLLLALTGIARADLTIEVRGRVRIDVERIQREGDHLLVEGSLLDEALSEPMPGRQVELRLGALEDGVETAYYTISKPTSVDGVFRFSVPGIPRARFNVHLSGPAYGDYAAAKTVDRTVDLTKRNVELRLHAPTEHPAASPSIPVTIEMVSLDRGGEDGVRRAEPIVELDLDGVRVTTLQLSDGRGIAALALPQAAAGHELELKAHFRGDEDRAPAEAVVRVLLVDQSKVDLAAESPRTLALGDVLLSGHLRLGARTLGGLPIVVRRIDAPRDGSPPGASTDAPSVTVQTRADGSFSTKLPAPDMAGRVGFEASFPATEAKTRGLLPASSEIVVVEVLPRLALFGEEPRPTVLALVIGGCLALGVFGQRMLARVRAHRAARAALGDPRDAATKVKAKSMPARLFGTLRLPSDRRVAGRVLDGERGRPIAGAEVRLRSDDATELLCLTGLDGTFAWASAPKGAVELFVAAAGHAPTAHAGEVPHRGELAALELSLVPLRAEIMRRYAAAIEPHLAPGERLGLRTPRELANALVKSARVRKIRLDGRKLTALRELVESACYADGAARPEALAEVTKLASELPSHA